MADDRLEVPLSARRRLLPRNRRNPDAFGKVAEAIARFIGTPKFLLYMTVFCALWLSYNTFAPVAAQFDPRAQNFTLLTLILSLQASYSAPLILLAQDRQADRDRVGAEQDRVRAERNLADTEYLAREMAALRMALNDVATRDFLRSELRNLLEELQEEREDTEDAPVLSTAKSKSKSKSKSTSKKPSRSRSSADTRAAEMITDDR